MNDNDINVVSLSKSMYDSMRETNTRAKLFLNNLLDINHISLSEDEQFIVFDNKAINDSLQVLFNDTYKKKLGALRTKHTKELMGK